MILYKDNELTLKDIDTTQGIISAYIVSFGNKDSDGDIIQKGAYTKSIKERGPQSHKSRIKHFKNHNSSLTPGKIIELIEDSTGVLMRSQLVNTTLGKDTLIEYEQGIITEHSHGFEIMKSHEHKDVQIITEGRLWEGSTLNAWGANENTPTVSVKDIYSEIDSLEQKLRVGSFSDQYLQDVEIRLKSLLNHLSQPETTEAKKSDELLNIFKSSLNN